jgi:toxin CcdB
MRQFDVFTNPAVRARRAFPLVILLQSDRAPTGRERVVAPLVPRRAVVETNDKLALKVNVTGGDFVIMVPLLSTAPVSELRNAVANLAAEHDRIVAALDYLFLGF